jgi:hypothetical protein
MYGQMDIRVEALIPDRGLNGLLAGDNWPIDSPTSNF